MLEFQTLIDEHKEIYEVINKFKATQNSTNLFEILDRIKNLVNLLDKIINVHFASEEQIIFPKIKKQQDLINCVLDEHKEIQHQKDLLEELFNKYNTNPTNIAYEALTRQANSIADTLYNHAYAEDVTLFAFAGIELSQQEKEILAEELAKLSCRSNL